MDDLVVVDVLDVFELELGVLIELVVDGASPVLIKGFEDSLCGGHIVVDELVEEALVYDLVLDFLELSVGLFKLLEHVFKPIEDEILD